MRPDRDEAVPALGEPGAVRQPEQEPAGEAPSGPAHEYPDGDLPHHVDHEPLERPDARPEGVHLERDGEVDEWEGQAVVEPGLGGQGEPHPRIVAFARPADLHVGRQHRIRRRQHRAEQDRRGRSVRPSRPQPRSAMAAIDSGMATPSSRQVTAQRRHPIGVSSLSPAPISETMTRNSVTRSVTSGCSCGSGYRVAERRAPDQRAQQQQDHRHGERQPLDQARQPRRSPASGRRPSVSSRM